MQNLSSKNISTSRKKYIMEKAVIMKKLTELLSQESLITPDEKAKLLKLIRKEKNL